MTLEILEYVPTALDINQKKSGTWEKLGHIRIRGEKMELWMEAIKGKNGGAWFRIPNVRVGSEWKPSYEIVDKPGAAFGKWVTEQLADEFKAKYM